MKEKVLIRKYNKKDLERLSFVVSSTINKSYLKFYPPEAIKYFLDLHAKENMKKDIPKGCTLMIELDGKIIATGSIVENEIKRVFVLPEYQGKGYGTKIMMKIEEAALNQGIRKVELCASLPSKDFYLALGYKIVRFTHFLVNNNKKLEYYDMEKNLGSKRER
jgi:GNAT superfamily N-acetyltransferase